MNWVAVRALVDKDLATVRRNAGVRVPLIVAPLIILVLLPTLLVLAGDVLSSSQVVPVDDIGASLIGEATSEETIREATGRATNEGGFAIFVLEVFLAPLYLLVPLVVSTVIAADSFAGERERGTLEALLHTPTTDRELLTAKFISSWLPAVTVGVVGFGVYSVVANTVAWPSVGRIFFPNLTWILLGFWVTPALAALGLGLMVIVSSRVQSLQSAHQIGSLVVLPIIILVIAQVSGAIRLGPGSTFAMGAALWIGAAVLLRIGAVSLRRENLALRL